MHAAQEKNAVAKTSVLAAVFLTGTKLVAGLLTGSLGILSEAAHSALDLVAALVTYFAVRISDRPADATHHYGHGKVENLSALVETLLLLLTCVWIIYEAIRRVFFADVHVDASIWAFAVMLVSIIVDVGRSRALRRVAMKHNSQALEADALHFSTDIWSSSVVIVGLLLTWAQQRFAWPAAWAKADAVAALGVAGIVVWVSIQLGKRTVAVLLDTAPPGLKEQITEAVSELPGVVAVTQARLRQSGPSTFVDLNIAADSGVSLRQAHDVAGAVEQKVRSLVPHSDVVVHVDPVPRPGARNAYETVRHVAVSHGLGVHSLHIHDIRGELHVELHAEVPEHLTLEQAHSLVSDMETSLLRELAGVVDIVTHIEPVVRAPSHEPLSHGEAARITEAVKSLAEGACGTGHTHRITVRGEAGTVSIALHCQLAGNLPITEAHDISEKLEASIRRAIPNVGQVVVHLEPLGQG